MKDKCVDEAYDLLGIVCYFACSRFVPLKKQRSYKSRWINKGIKEEIKLKHSSWSKYISSNKKSKKSLERYKLARNKLNFMVRSALRNYERMIISKGKKDPKLIYSYINDKLKVSNSIKTLKISEGTTNSDENLIAEDLNDFFNSVFSTNMNQKNPKIC